MVKEQAPFGWTMWSVLALKVFSLSVQPTLSEGITVITLKMLESDV